MHFASYSWAQPAVAELCTLDPRNVDFCLRADLPTMHYIAFAIRGFQKGGGEASDFAGFASRIASLPRRAVIADLWSIDPGKLGALARLGGRVLAPKSYDWLAVVLNNPSRRGMLYKAGKISPKLLKFAAETQAPCVEDIGFATFAKLGETMTLYLAASLARLRPDLTMSQIGEILAKIEEPARIKFWLQEQNDRRPLPMAPWAGTSLIVPTTTVGEMLKAGVQLKNCLGASSLLGDALRGTRAFYVLFERGKRPIGAASLVHDSWLAAWRLNQVMGVENGELSPTNKRKVVAEFERAGFPCLLDKQMRGDIV